MLKEVSFSTHNWPLAAEFVLPQQLAALPTKILKTVLCFFSSCVAKFLATLSVGEEVTGVKAVAGRTSHISKAHCQWLLHVRFSSWMKSSRGRLGFRLTSTQSLQQGWVIKVGGDLGSIVYRRPSAWEVLLRSGKSFSLAVCSHHC